MQDRSSRSLFPTAKSSEFNHFNLDADSRLEHSLSNSNDPTDQSKLENTLLLKDIIRKYKIKSIVSNFVRKIKRISVSSKPVEFEREDDSNKGLLWSEACIELPQFAENIFSLLSIMQVLILSIAVSLSLVFSPLHQS